MKKIKYLAIQGDKIQKINPKTDTTLLLALEAQRRNYRILYYQTKDLKLINGKLFSKCKEIIFKENSKINFEFIKEKTIDLSKIHIILMRQDPPFNMDYITATYLLDFVSKKTLIINNPKMVRNISEKLFSINFIKFMPPTMFTRNFFDILEFKRKYKKIVLKPIHGYGGKNILFEFRNLNKKKILKYITQHGHIMVQKFLPGIVYGDKRVFIIKGKIQGAIKRIPKKGSMLSNIGMGAIAKKTTLNKKERKISSLVAKKLYKNKITFAGIDLISSKLTGDINITSPTGLKAYKDLTGIDLAINFWDSIEEK